jgi:hypothetical protein
MKHIILQITLLLLTYTTVKGQFFLDSTKIDTLEFYQNLVIIKYPINFVKIENSLDYGGTIIYYTSQPPRSIITVMEATNSEFDFGKNCIITDEYVHENRYTTKGICLLNEYFRSDFFRGSRIIITYQNVSDSDYKLFEFLMDSIIVNNYCIFNKNHK